MHRGIDLTATAYEAAFAAFERAVANAKGQKPFSKICGCSQGAISQRLIKRQLLVAEWVLKAEAATGVSRHELRPDIYPLDPEDPLPSPGANLGAGAPIGSFNRGALLNAEGQTA